MNDPGAAAPMKWVTRKRIHVNRTATGWLIRRFLDPRAEILFVEAGQVAAVQERDGAIGFDAPGATYSHRDDRGRCSFEALLEEKLPGDAALARLGEIVHGADFPAEMDITHACRRFVVPHVAHVAVSERAVASVAPAADATLREERAVTDDLD